MSIKPHRPRPLGIHLDVTNRLWQSVMEDSIKFTWMNRPHWLVLSTIEELGNGCNLTQINAFLNLEISTCSRAIVWLEKNNLITRVEDQNDKRARVLHITDEGAAMLQQLDEAAQTVRAEMLKDVTPEQLAVFEQVLDAIKTRAAHMLSSPDASDILHSESNTDGPYEKTLPQKPVRAAAGHGHRRKPGSGR
ncbi:MarR family transcriptional regulator [Enterobacteriaceae bacterium 4M9]|nr:MarR family transcriptional regulator [Enterobacteriaceae bacterium 4M9]